MKILLIVLVLISAGMAQNAVVVELSPKDAAEARKAFEAKRSADKAWDDLYARIQQAHPTKEFALGMNFSEDFRFIVPDRPTPTSGTGSFVSTVPWGCGALSPYLHTALPDGAVVVNGYAVNAN